MCPTISSRERQTFAEYIRYLAERGEYGAGRRPGGAGSPAHRAMRVNPEPMSARGRMAG